VGGVGYEYLGAHLLFLICSAVCLVCAVGIMLYGIMSRRFDATTTTTTITTKAVIACDKEVETALMVPV
jgi:hypothetical protein